MTKLWMLASEYQQAAAALEFEPIDDVATAALLDAISDDIERKAENIGFLIRHLDAESAAIAEWAEQAKARAKAIDNRAQALRDYLAGALQSVGVEQIKRPGIVIGWRKSSAVVIDEAAQIPAEYMRVKPAPAPEPDKKLIGDDIKLGVIVPGARVEQRKTLQIK